MKREFVVFLVGLTALIVCPTATSSASSLLTPMEYEFVELVNCERFVRNQSWLEIDPILTLAARKHSAEMRDKKYFGHESPTAGHKTPMDRYIKACNGPVGYALVGENLFWATIQDTFFGHESFMASESHADNVLFPRFEKIGVGIVTNKAGEFWVTQMFLTNKRESDTTVKRSQ